MLFPMRLYCSARLNGAVIPAVRISGCMYGCTFLCTTTDKFLVGGSYDGLTSCCAFRSCPIRFDKKFCHPIRLATLQRLCMVAGVVPIQAPESAGL